MLACCAVLLLSGIADAKGSRFGNGGQRAREYIVTLNSVRLLYYSDSYIGAAGGPVANYITARAELSLNSSVVLPLYAPAYVSSPTIEDELRRSIWAQLPARRECTVGVNNIVVSGLSRTQIVFRVLAPAMCAPPEDDVDNAIASLFGGEREIVSGVLRLSTDEHSTQRELCASGFLECEANRCARGMCGEGHCHDVRGDYLCECHIGRDWRNDDVYSFSGVRCGGPRRTCAACGTGATCSISGCTCLHPYINRSGGCHHRRPCAELAPCMFGSCADLGRSFQCACPVGFSGALCGTMSPSLAILGPAVLALSGQLASQASWAETFASCSE